MLSLPALGVGSLLPLPTAHGDGGACGCVCRTYPPLTKLPKRQNLPGGGSGRGMAPHDSGLLSPVPMLAAAPAAVDRVLRADKLEIRWSVLGVGIQGALEGRDHLGRLGDHLAVPAARPRHRRHARLGVVRDLERVRIVALAPEAGAVTRVAA